MRSNRSGRVLFGDCFERSFSRVNYEITIGRETSSNFEAKKKSLNKSKVLSNRGGWHGSKTRESEMRRGAEVRIASFRYGGATLSIVTACAAYL